MFFWLMEGTRRFRESGGEFIAGRGGRKCNYYE